MNKAILLASLRAAVEAMPEILPHLSPTARAALKASGDYTSIRTEMSGEIHDAVYDYLTGYGYVTIYWVKMSLAVSKAWIEATDAAYVEGGGELPIDMETADWARAQLDIQLAYVDQLFATLRELRQSGDVNAAAEALSRANGYASSLDQQYSEAKARGAKNKMLTMVGDDGKESCKDCQRMKGQRHRASWWISHDMVPGSSNYECQGWRCEHFLIDDNGERFTI